MKKSFVILVLILLSTLSFSQIQDIDIVNVLIGSNVFQFKESMDSLGLWFHPNPRPSQESNTGYHVSIENENKTTKLFIFDYDGNGKIIEIYINYQHDSRQQLEELEQIKKYFDVYHVGKFSTDIKISYKKWRKLQ